LLERLSHAVLDHGTHTPQSVDYPDFAAKVAAAVASGQADRGILVCGTGIGMSLAANKVPGIRAALCYSVETAVLSRSHNDANVLTLGGRTTDHSLALRIVEAWLCTDFSGGRHTLRVAKIAALEEPGGLAKLDTGVC
jgi:ribose 5-phosphate isomerase B